MEVTCGQQNSRPESPGLTRGPPTPGELSGELPVLTLLDLVLATSVAGSPADSPETALSPRPLPLSLLMWGALLCTPALQDHVCQALAP